MGAEWQRRYSETGYSSAKVVFFVKHPFLYRPWHQHFRLNRAPSVRIIGIGPGASTGGVGAPAGGVVPAVAPAGGVGVDGDEEHVVLAQAPVVVAHAAAALGQEDVGLFGDEEGGDEAG